MKRYNAATLKRLGGRVMQSLYCLRMFFRAAQLLEKRMHSLHVVTLRSYSLLAISTTPLFFSSLSFFQKQRFRRLVLLVMQEPLQKCPPFNFKLIRDLFFGVLRWNTVGQSFKHWMVFLSQLHSCFLLSFRCQQLSFGCIYLCFLSIQDLAAEIILTLGEAFEVAYQMAVKEQSLHTQQQQQQQQQQQDGHTSASSQSVTSQNLQLTNSSTAVRLWRKTCNPRTVIA